MAEEMSWEERIRRTREALDPLRFLLGEWRGEGQVHGEALYGQLSVASVLGDSFLEARERLVDASGALSHEDISYYRYDVRERQLRVNQLMAGAWQAEQWVVPTEAGCRWYAGPFAAKVEFVLQSDGSLLIEIYDPEATSPSGHMTYRRA